MRFDLVVIGASAGGLEAVSAILEGLPEGFAPAIAVTMHRGDAGEPSPAATLQRRCPLPVREAEDKDIIEPAQVYLAPAGYHLLVERGEFALSVDERVCYARPSVDALFESAADAYGERVVGVILTGGGEDGAQGAARIASARGLVVVQDPATAAVDAMPRAAIAAVETAEVRPLESMAAWLLEYCSA